MKALNLHLLVKLLLYWYIFIFLSTEILSYLRILERGYILLGEIFFWILFLFFHRQEIISTAKKIDFRSKSTLFILTIFLLTFIQGLFSAPNSTDSMVYHLPRVMYWMQEKTLFQDVVRNAHDYMPPFGQYILLHLYLIFDNDKLLFFSQWLAFVVTIVVSAAISRHLGANKQISAIASLLVASIPVAVMQATSTKIELIVTVLVVICTYIALRFREENIWDYLAIGFGLGLGVLTKQTFLIYAVIPAGILFIKFLKLLKSKKSNVLFIPLICVIIILTQIRFFSQNLLLYGNASGSKDDYSGLTNQSLTPTGISSNLIKNTMLHIPVPIYTKQVEDILLSFHRIIGIDISDCATTFCDPAFKFRIIRAIYPQEDIAANTPQLLLIFIAGFVLIRELIKRRIDYFELLIFTLAVFSYFAFSALLKWQPFHSRLHMPFFVIGVISSVTVLSKLKKGLFILKGFLVVSVSIAIPLIFLNVARSYISYNLFYDNIKFLAMPLSDIPESFLIRPREQQYFNSRFYWHQPYKDIMGMVSKQQPTGKNTITFKLMDNFEYPLWVFAKKSNLSLRVVPNSQALNRTIIISTSKEPYQQDGYITQCIKTEIEYGYACLSAKSGNI